MSGLFASYEEDYKEGVARLTASMALLKESVDAQQAHEKDPTVVYHPPPATGATSRPHQLQDCQQTLAHLKDLVTSMGYEVHELEPSQVAKGKATVDEFRKQIVVLDRDVSQLRHKCTAAERADLLAFGGSSGKAGFVEETDAETQAQRLQSLQTTEKLQGGTSTLLKAEAYLAQSNDLGYSTLGTLRAQTEQMHRVQTTTHDVDAEVTQAREVIRTMQRTALKHKCWLFGIIVMLIAFICLLFYLHGR